MFEVYCIVGVVVVMISNVEVYAFKISFVLTTCVINVNAENYPKLLDMMQYGIYSLKIRNSLQ